MIDILLKLGIAIAVVLAIASAAKRFGSSVGGILLGLPLGAGINFYFVYAEYGVAFTLRAVPWGIDGLTATLAFGLCYVVAGRLIGVRSKALQIILTSLSATAVYFVVSLILRLIQADLVVGILVTILAAGSTVASLTLLKVPRHVTSADRDSIHLLVIRGLTAGLFVVAITAVAGRVGPAWTGLFSTFPVMLLPLLVLLHWDEGPRLYPGLIFGFSFSVLNLIAFFGLLELLLPVLPFAIVYLIVYSVSALLLWLLNGVKNRVLTALEGDGSEQRPLLSKR